MGLTITDVVLDGHPTALRADATLQLLPDRNWFAGKATCLPFIATYGIGRCGEWRMLPVRANGQLAAAAYRRDDDGVHRPFAVVVLATTSTRLPRITLCCEPDVFEHFQLPATCSRGPSGATEARSTGSPLD